MSYWYAYLIKEGSGQRYPKGRVFVQEKPLAKGYAEGKEFETTIRNLESWAEHELTVIALGRFEFEDQADYEENIMNEVKPVAQQYKEDSGLNSGEENVE